MIKLAKKYIVDSQFFVSLMGTIFAIFFSLDYQNISFSMVLVVFITYLNGYLYTKYQATKDFKTILILNFILGVFCLYLIFKNPEIIWYKWFIIIALGLLYNSFFLSKIIREIPLIKVFYVGFTWALLNAWFVLPMFDWKIFVISWFYITALVLPFDIRDMNVDEVVTFPKIIGVQNTKYLTDVLLFLAGVLGVYSLSFYHALALFLSILVSYGLIYFANTDRRDLYYSFGVELCVGLPFLFYILLKYF